MILKFPALPCNSLKCFAFFRQWLDNASENIESRKYEFSTDLDWKLVFFCKFLLLEYKTGSDKNGFLWLPL